MPWLARPISLTEQQTSILEDLSRSRSGRSDHATRAKIILLSAEGYSTSSIANQVPLKSKQVSLWRNRWADHEKTLLTVEAEEERSIEYRRYIESLLSDEFRTGAPPKFTAEQICQIFSVATESPEDSDIPLSHWSLTSLQEEVIKRGIVESISTSQLSRFLKSAGAKAA